MILLRLFFCFYYTYFFFQTHRKKIIIKPTFPWIRKPKREPRDEKNERQINIFKENNIPEQFCYCFNMLNQNFKFKLKKYEENSLETHFVKPGVEFSHTARNTAKITKI